MDKQTRAEAFENGSMKPSGHGRECNKNERKNNLRAICRREVDWDGFLRIKKSKKVKWQIVAGTKKIEYLFTLLKIY